MVVDEGTILFGEYYSPIVKKCSSHLGEYFAGARTIFDSNLFTACTNFQQAVWARLQNIGYGKTLSQPDH